VKGNGILDAAKITIELIEPKKIGWKMGDELLFSMTAEQSSVAAEHLARLAFAAHTGRAPDDRGSELARQIKAKAVDELRPRLITRHAAMLRSFLRKDPSPTVEDMSERLVDQVLKEVT